jgi:hypothetical protein
MAALVKKAAFHNDYKEAVTSLCAGKLSYTYGATDDARVPFAEFQRFIAHLRAMPQTGKTGKPSPASKLLAHALRFQKRVTLAREALAAPTSEPVAALT